MEMRERIARALCEANDRDPDQLEPGDAYGIDAVLPNGDPAHCLWRGYVEQADAVLDAMMEPTNYMCSFGPYINEVNPAVPPITESQADACWRHMIDAARKPFRGEGGE